MCGCWSLETGDGASLMYAEVLVGREFEAALSRPPRILSSLTIVLAEPLLRRLRKSPFPSAVGGGSRADLRAVASLGLTWVLPGGRFVAPCSSPAVCRRGDTPCFGEAKDLVPFRTFVLKRTTPSFGIGNKWGQTGMKHKTLTLGD